MFIIFYYTVIINLLEKQNSNPTNKSRERGKNGENAF